MIVPEAFGRRMFRVYGAAGTLWVSSLPRLVEEIQTLWNVRVGQAVPNLTYNFVAPAEGEAGERYVVKLSPGGEEGAREAAAMSAFAGRVATRLVRRDAGMKAMLLERAEPGDDLRPVPDPEAALIAADVLERLWSAQPTEGLADLEEWTRVLERFAGRQHPLPIEHFARASRLRRELLADPPERVVLHGDLHHTNVLRTEDRGWLAIDPKGVTGEKAFDIVMFLLNPEPVPWERDVGRVVCLVDRV
jgi:streptomycin 6-kinase